MAYFKNNPPSKDELSLWIKDKTLNPRTKRKIKVNSPIYKIIEMYYNRTKELSWKDLTDDEDPVSLITFWELKNNEKVLSKEIKEDEIIIYQENNLVRGFHFETILGFYQNKITKHPISGQLIPESVFIKMKELCLEKNISIEKKDDIENIKDLALRVFQLFNNMSIYIDNEAYCNLQSSKIHILANELNSFYKENLSIQQKNQVNPNNKNLFKKTNYEETRRQILLDMKYIIENANSNNKILVCYLMLAGLVLVIPELKETYPHLEFGFQI